MVLNMIILPLRNRVKQLWGCDRLWVHKAAASSDENYQVKFICLLELLEKLFKFIDVAVDAIQTCLFKRSWNFVSQLYVSGG